MDRKIQNIIMIVLFVISVIVIFIGQRNVGYAGLGLEILGLFGLISILFTYNRRYK